VYYITTPAPASLITLHHEGPAAAHTTNKDALHRTHNAGHAEGALSAAQRGMSCLPAPSGWASESRDVSVQALRIDTPIRRVHHDSTTLTDDPPPAATCTRSAPAARVALVTCVAAHAGHGQDLWVAAVRGDIDAIKSMLAAGTDVHGNSNDALRWAAFFHHVAVARVLLAAGADPIIAWRHANVGFKKALIFTLDACADALTPDQRLALAGESEDFINMRTWSASTRHRQPLLC